MAFAAMMPTLRPEDDNDEDDGESGSGDGGNDGGGSDGGSDGSGGRSDGGSDDGDDGAAPARQPDSPAGWRQTAVPAHAKLKWSPQHGAWTWVGCRGGFIRLAVHAEIPITRKTAAAKAAHTRVQAAKLHSPLRLRCSHLRARCLQNRCQVSCSAGCVATAAMVCSTDRAKSPTAVSAASRTAATRTRSLVGLQGVQNPYLQPRVLQRTRV